MKIKTSLISFEILVCIYLFISCHRIPADKNPQIYSVDVRTVKTNVTDTHLDMGGTNLNGDKLDVNSFYMTYSGVPFIPVIREFHYARFPDQYWNEEIQKMKAGGITVVATYVFWNLHERKIGQFDWTGDLNLRKFVELCQAYDLGVILRIGPFVHAEIRNGGLPDWLYGLPCDVHSLPAMDQDYLHMELQMFLDLPISPRS